METAMEAELAVVIETVQPTQADNII